MAQLSVNPFLFSTPTSSSVNNTFGFSVASFNVLAREYARPDQFPYVDADLLRWSQVYLLMSDRCFNTTSHIVFDKNDINNRVNAVFIICYCSALRCD